MKQDLPVRVETVGHVPERFTKRIQKQRRWGIAVRRLSNSSTETHISREKRDHRKYRRLVLVSRDLWPSV